MTLCVISAHMPTTFHWYFDIKGFVVLTVYWLQCEKTVFLIVIELYDNCWINSYLQCHEY
jgi:hypothetical protein